MIMRKIQFVKKIIYLTAVFAVQLATAQVYSPITFDPEGNDYTWIKFDNDPGTWEIVANPDASGMNTSATVGKYVTDVTAPEWAGVKTDALDPVIITENNKFLTMDVYKTDTESKIGLKYEGGTGGNQIDAFVENVQDSVWEKLVFDFSSAVGDTFPTFVIFPDWPLDGTREEEAVTYFDNIEWHAEDPVHNSELDPITFDPEGVYYNWIKFDNDPGIWEIVANPDASGVNTSATVGKYVTDVTAPEWAGVKTDALDPVIITENNKFLTMDVYKTGTDAKVGLKAEGGTTGYVEDYDTNTVAGVWEKLVFDFSSAVGDTFPTFVIFPDWPLDGTREEEAVTYFDNIEWHAEHPDSVTTVSVSSLAETITVYPNPVADVLHISVVNNTTIQVLNINGCIIKTIQVPDNTDYELSMGDVTKGIYIINVSSGDIVKVFKIIKH